MDFGNGALASVGQSDLFIVQFGGDLAPLWSRRFGDEGSQTFGHVAADGKRFIYLGCKISQTEGGTVNFGAGDLVANPNDIAVVKLAP